jgi:hypothetical protein
MEGENYKIAIEGDWSLEDFYVFGRTFEQIYFFSNSVIPVEDSFEQERLQRAYEGFPWQGGYSSVNFFNNIKYIVAQRDRPTIVSIHYGSPGWLELSLWIGVALAVERLIKTVASSINLANSTYHEVVTGLQKRKLLRLKVRELELDINIRELAYIKDCAETIANILGFKDLEHMHQMTGNPYKSMKILLAVYRRVRTLAEFETKGKTKFPDEGL